MLSRSVALVVPPTLFAAQAAQACGACVDLGLQARFWGAPGLTVLGLLLVVEVLVTGLVWRFSGYRPRVKRGRALLLAFILGLGTSLVLGGSGFALGLGMVVVLLPSFVLSIVREMPGSKRAARPRQLGVRGAARARADADTVIEGALHEAGASNQARLAALHGKLTDPAHHAALCARLLALAPDDGARRVLESACAPGQSGAGSPAGVIADEVQ